jgi:hypothetical protein
MTSLSRAAAAAAFITLTTVSSRPISAQVANGSSREKTEWQKRDLPVENPSAKK